MNGSTTVDKPIRKVLNGLKRKGYEVYLVGGCVRDLILKGTLKDFDILTSAELREVTRTFSWCEVVGRRFPICRVHVGDTVVEVSSFSISARSHGRNSSSDIKKPVRCDDKDFMRWSNCLKRDFTINGLMFDPYERIVYDYLGGIEDLKNAKVQTVIPANTSFREDCARILRAIRIAARLGFRISKETADSIKNLSYSIVRLDKGRILMEMNYMMAYGSAEASLRLLWKFGLLELLLPIQAAYFVCHGFRRRDKRSNMLLSLFSNLDKLLAPDKRCHSSLWIAILAFHKALSEQPRDVLVVAAFTLAVHNGGDMLEAVEIARTITKPHEVSFHELLEPQRLDSGAYTKEIKDLEASFRRALDHMTDAQIVSEAMAAYPQAPFSDLVFIPWGLSLRVSWVFNCVKVGGELWSVAKQGSKIDYDSFAQGSLPEIRHIFARVPQHQINILTTFNSGLCANYYNTTILVSSGVGLIPSYNFIALQRFKCAELQASSQFSPLKSSAIRAGFTFATMHLFTIAIPYQAELYMTVSTTPRTKDPDIIHRAKEIIVLLSKTTVTAYVVDFKHLQYESRFLLLFCLADCTAFSFSVTSASHSDYQVIDILNGDMVHDHIKTGYQEDGLAAIHGIKRERFVKRQTRFLECLKDFSRLLNVSLYVNGNTVTAAGTSLEQVKVIRRIVERCYVENVSPAAIVSRLNMRLDINNAEHALTLFMSDKH
ncbi:hypothetical protein ACLB2K_049207 [Fragaria x ananassa]